MRLAAKRTLGRLIPPAPTPRRVALIYHALGDSPSAQSPHDFAHQIEWLARHATVTTASNLATLPAESALNVAITFDDGYASVTDHARAILTDSGMAATVFICTDEIRPLRHVSDPAAGHYPGEVFMCWDDVAGLASAGWEVGSHGATHVDHSAIAQPAAAMECTSALAALRTRLGTARPAFAYTWGRATRPLARLIQETGYGCAFTGIHGALDKADDPFLLPRIAIPSDLSLSDFIAIVTGRWDYLRPWQQLRALAR